MPDAITTVLVCAIMDDDNEEAGAYLYCGTCSETILDDIDGHDIMALYLKAREHVAAHE